MTMEIVKQSFSNQLIVRKPMNEMNMGEVCYCEIDSNYVIRVDYPSQKNTYMMLKGGNDSYGNDSYGHDCVKIVRELYTNESITITFS